ncbi:hypothetical protein QEM02_001644 [Pseudomonas putida]|nr:hypothetical protein [Pseudomonas putida]
MITNDRPTYHLEVQNHTIDQLLEILSRRPIDQLVLQCTTNRRIDIGSLCFREKIYKTRKIPKAVNVATLVFERSAAIRAWCEDHITKCKLDSTGETLFASGEGLAQFVNWCDNGSHLNFHESDKSFKRALDAYSQHLLISIESDSGIKSARANRLQADAIKSATYFFPTSTLNFLNDLPIIHANRGDRSGEGTPTPSDMEMGKYLAACQYVFDGVSDFVLKGQNFPSRFPYFSTEAIILPTELPISTPPIIEANEKARASVIWDYHSGRIRTLAESLTHSIRPAARLVIELAEANANLRKSNLNLRDPKRIWLGHFAHAAFIPLFVANTGMNESPLRKLLWSKDYEISNGDEAGFSVIKMRAGGMEQSFNIRKTFIKHFNKFMKLREYLCGEENREHMFLRYVWNELVDAPIGKSPILAFNVKMSFFLDPNFQGLSHRQLRKYKPVHLLSKNHDISLVSAMMQNSGETIMKHYSDAEEKTAIDEISATLSFIISTLSEKSSIETPGGGCSGGSSSQYEQAPDQYAPDCRNFVGCIYCDKFRLHVDEVSIRKLYSMRFITAERITSCTDMEQFQTLHGGALQRIDALITDLIHLKPEAKDWIEQIKTEVEEDFKLHPYWETLYSRLLKLKVIK